MNKMSKREYLIEVRKKYRTASRAVKTQLLNDFCQFTRYHRKSALRLLHKPLPRLWKRYDNRVRTRTKKYNQLVINALLLLWRAANEICGERLQPFLPELLAVLERCGEIVVTTEVREKLGIISVGTVKKILQHQKHVSLIKIGGTTKPGSLLKHQISIRYGRWTETTPGWCETDTVAHCGETAAGEFIYSLDVIDISSGWSEQAAIMGKGEKACVAQIEHIRQRLPFPLLGLDPDNGSEFINWHLHRYAKRHHVTLTRSRPYHKNDNAHVEQKNYTAIRQFIGYARLDTQEQLRIINDLYANEWRLYLNFFQPTLKLKEKRKDETTGKTTKKYHESKTPYQRIMEHPNTTLQQKAMLQSQYHQLNPIQLQREINTKLELLKKTLK